MSKNLPMTHCWLRWSLYNYSASHDLSTLSYFRLIFFFCFFNLNKIYVFLLFSSIYRYFLDFLKQLKVEHFSKFKALPLAVRPARWIHLKLGRCKTKVKLSAGLWPSWHSNLLVHPKVSISLWAAAVVAFLAIEIPTWRSNSQRTSD